MSKRPNPELPDDDNPEWTADDLARAKPSAGLPESLRGKLALRTRGQQRAPLKTPTTIRFDADVLAALRATGPGWQTRVNEAMREWVKSRRA